MNSHIQSVGAKIRKSGGRKKNIPLRQPALVYIFFLLLSANLLVCCYADSEKWEKKISGITWVAYSPPSADPGKGIEAMPKDIREDLALLRKAGFTGLVTYSSLGVLGRELPTIAKMLRFKGLIMGIWDPSDPNEINAAKAAANTPIVLGFCVGNEGLGKRYQLPELAAAIQNLRVATGKLVTTTEEIDDYSDERFLKLGDWILPNAHPYFHNQLDPDAAVQWTKAAYQDLKRRSNRFVLFKEVGLPTAGDPERKMSEDAQERYYLELAKTDVQFVYFEAFDQPWKTHLPIEPHWGIFRSDRTPKLLGKYLLSDKALEETCQKKCFYVYLDADSSKNHFKPTGYMGDCGDIHINEAFENNPHSGETCVRVVYDAKGKGPSECQYAPPCKWAGVYWQEPPNNWGKDAVWKGRGFDLSGYKRLTFWARAEKECRIEFKVGGINEPFGDSLKYPRSKTTKLTTDWRFFEIDLEGADLKHIIGGFCWVTNWDANPEGATFYLDDIRFEPKVAVSIEISKEIPLPFEDIYYESLSTKAIEFDKKVKTLFKGAPRATVLKCLGEPTTRRTLIPVTSTEFEITQGVLVQGLDFYWGSELKKGEKKEYEVWEYEIDEGVRPISVSTSPLSGSEGQERTTTMRVIFPYLLYFVDDTLEEVNIGLSMSQTPPK